MNVFFLQPLVPHYRVPFFQRLARTVDFHLSVHASERVPGQSLSTAPECLGPDAPFEVHLHPCRAFAGGRLFWQDVSLPRGFGRGDVFVMPGAPRWPRNFTLAAEARARGAAVVWFGQGYGVGASRPQVAARHVFARLCDHAVLYTESETRRWLAAGFPVDRLTAMNNALDQAPIRAASAAVTAEAVAALRAAHGLEGRHILLMVGRLTPKAGAEVLVEALRDLPADYTAVFIGGGEDTPIVQTRTVELGLRDRVRLLGPIYDEALLAPWFRAADVFVYPGGIGLSIHHAFGYGLPVVTHGDADEQMPEFAALVPGVNGEIFPHGDAKALARTLAALCGDTRRRADLSKGAAETVATGWNIDDMVARFAAAIRIAGRRRGA
jgi:glycosyltransferase involved in cell wall biosynthesis